MREGRLPVILTVPARLRWVDTGVSVHPDDVLTFRSEGCWVDAVIPCDANGYRARLFYAFHVLPRIPDEGRYFRLMGRIALGSAQPSIDIAELTFPIGAAFQWRATHAGRIFVFANDRDGFYWNNWGAVRLTIS